MTTLPQAQPIMLGTPQQQLAVLTNQAVSKIIAQEPLSDTNFCTCSLDIRTGLGSYYYSDYLESDETKDKPGAFVHKLSRKCFTAWILRQMDKENGARFEPKITSYSKQGSKILDLPAKLWSKLNEYHAARSEELILLAEQSLNKIVQAANTPLNIHMQNFQSALNMFKSLGGILSNNEIGRKLLISLNPSYYRDARDILVLGILDYNEVVIQLKQRLTTETFLAPTMNSSNQVKNAARQAQHISAQTNAQRRNALVQTTRRNNVSRDPETSTCNVNGSLNA